MVPAEDKRQGSVCVAHPSRTPRASSTTMDLAAAGSSARERTAGVLDYPGAGASPVMTMLSGLGKVPSGGDLDLLDLAVCRCVCSQFNSAPCSLTADAPFTISSPLPTTPSNRSSNAPWSASQNTHRATQFLQDWSCAWTTINSVAPCTIDKPACSMSMMEPGIRLGPAPPQSALYTCQLQKCVSSVCR
jgi:hypothetical protein